MVKSEGYSRAVENLELVTTKLAEHFTARERSTLQYNIFLLKMQPQYKQKETS